MNGVAIPSTSPGSSQREASVMCTPQVMVPSGAAAVGPAPTAIRTSATTEVTTWEPNRVMAAAQCRVMACRYDTATAGTTQRHPLPRSVSVRNYGDPIAADPPGGRGGGGPGEPRRA